MGAEGFLDGTTFRVPGLSWQVTLGSAAAAQPRAGMRSTPLGSRGCGGDAGMMSPLTARLRGVSRFGGQAGPLPSDALDGRGRIGASLGIARSGYAWPLK